jgi:dTDP-4-dehydrorhamnose 3,5-epimerase
MKIIRTNFKGLLLINRKSNRDIRGILSETYIKKNFISENFIFDYYSISKKNVIRGLHYQKKKQQDKIISVINGKIFDVCIDLRKNSKTFGKYFSIILSSKNHKSIFIPKGFAHGFCSLENNTIVYYKNSNYYYPNEQSGIIWNDPILNIKWPVNKPVMSIKDKLNFNFSEFLINQKFL